MKALFVFFLYRISKFDVRPLKYFLYVIYFFFLNIMNLPFIPEIISCPQRDWKMFVYIMREEVEKKPFIKNDTKKIYSSLRGVVWDCFSYKKYFNTFLCLAFAKCIQIQLLYLKAWHPTIDIDQRNEDVKKT